MSILTFFGVVRKVETMSQGALRIRIDTQENVSPEGAAALFAMKDAFGSWGFKTGDIPIDESDKIPDYTPEFKDDKSPSQRLRAVMYVFHKQKTIAEPFESWYTDQIEQLIADWKTELEE